MAGIRPGEYLVIKQSVIDGEELMGPASLRKTFGSPELLGERNHCLQ